MQQEKLWKLGQTPLSLIVPQDLETPLLMYTVENLRKKTQSDNILHAKIIGSQSRNLGGGTAGSYCLLLCQINLFDNFFDFICD